MAILLGLFISGIVVGLFIRQQQLVVRIAGKLTNGCVYSLLFILGTSIGTNDEALSQLSTLGYEAMVLSVGAVSGSVLLGFWLFIWMFKGKS